jgi:hypothetical protein
MSKQPSAAKPRRPPCRPRREHPAPTRTHHKRSAAYDQHPPTKRNLTGLETLAALLGPILDVPPLCPTCKEHIGEGECPACRRYRIAKNAPDEKTRRVLARGNRDVDQPFGSLP